MGARMFRKWRMALLALMFLVTAVPLHAFEGSLQNQSFFKEVGLITGYGRAKMTEGQYETVPVILHFGIDLSRYLPGLRGHRGLLTAYFEPQFNPVIHPGNDLEFGLGVGLQYQYPVATFLSLYANASTGPHYVTVDTTDQADGFIFANYVGAGGYFFLNKNTAVNAGYKFRHMSNARTREPNGGLDSHFGVIGVSFFY